jgi:hypothetical protein
LEKFRKFSLPALQKCVSFVYDRTMSKTRTQLFWSIAFLLGSIALWAKVAPVEHPPQPVAVVAPVSCPSVLMVEGVWEQYAVHGEDRQFMARLSIRSAGADYTASPLALSRDTFPKHAYRSYDHVEENGRWSFKEDWDGGNVGQFVLSRQCNGEYRGVATSLQNGQSFETVFVRVGE